MIETLLAIALLAVGVMGLATLIPYATRNDYRSRIDTTATFVAMRELEQILAQTYATTSFTDAADGNGATATVNLAAGGKALVGGNIDFTGTAPNGYWRDYVIVQTGGATPKVNADTYEIRWNISVSGTTGIKTIVIAAQQKRPKPGTTTVPANLRAVKMK